jgi:glutamate-1-semialdehyde 2,1-aminomutase
VSVAVIVQARMGSTRLPGKVLADLCGTPQIGVILSRLQQCRQVSQILVATTEDPKDDPLVQYVEFMGIPVFRGSEADVLDRYVRAADLAGASILVRITGDCPLVDPELVDELILCFKSGQVDYLSNVDPPTFPDGLDIEVFTSVALRRAWTEAHLPFDREHVTPYLRSSGKFRTMNIRNDSDLSGIRWTVDDPEDLVVMRGIFGRFQPDILFSWKRVADLMAEDPKLFLRNSNKVRNEGASMGEGQKLWKRAKRVIPGGNMLLSKRAEMFLPDAWPSYFSRASGCKVWDLDGRELVDMLLMGVGTNTLGYGNEEVDAAVAKVVRDGNMSTLNCPEEVYLAEALVELHPWAEMVRLARTGGEANAIAIRIARAASGKSKVAMCGYHGWHDWYLAANLGDERNLAGHLLPGLEPAGVPEDLRGSIIPFNYNRIDELELIVAHGDIGVIKMEVSRNLGPTDGFLEKVRKLATDKGIVLIFDECTSGFRQTYGGLHKMFGVEPDMAVFGKALGNGYAITAVIGRRDVMEAAQRTFISSTFWTERIGPAAALATLKVMKETRSWECITNTGRRVMAGWEKLGRLHGLKISTGGLPALASFSIDSPNMLSYKTLITQEMLDQGYLAATSLYACTQHHDGVVDRYLEKLERVFGLIKECEDGRDVAGLLKGPVCHAGFRRLN